MKYNRLTCFLIGIIFLVLFFLIAIPVYLDHSWIQSLDAFGDQFLRQEIPDSFATIFHEITTLADTNTIVLFTLILLLVLFIFKKWVVSTWTLGTIVICGLIVPQLLKLLILRERPESGLIYASGHSFPSGHATMATVFYGIIMVWALNFLKDGWVKQLIIIIMPILIALIAWSRVYLGVHYLSDILAGILLGTGQILIATSLYWKFYERPRG